MASSKVPVIVVDDRKDVAPNLSSSSPSPPHQQHRAVSTSSSSSSSSSLCTSSASPSTSALSSHHPVSSSSSSTQPISSPCTQKRDVFANACTKSERNDVPTSTPKINIHHSKPQISTRSSSDIGIPAASMPNLAEGGSEHNLGVYCSPRTTRRSVDLDMSETSSGQYEWMNALDTSANSLKVLTASSRVGSALSLNSECTTRSIGLLSNDSDTEEFSQSENKPSGQGQLRRYMSYPEEGQIPESNTRPSQSLSNLKSANQSPSLSRDRYLQRQSLDYADIGESTSTIIVPDDPGFGHSSKTKSGSSAFKENAGGERLSNIAVGESKDSLVENEGGVPVDSSSCKNRRSNAATSSNTGNTKRVIGSVRTANNNNMLCYKCDNNSPSREGRIRQWLQDMDTTQNNDVID